jgi:hypothetical protein
MDKAAAREDCPRSLGNVVDVFIVSNDILELVDRTFIVSIECACYIQSGRRASGQGNFDNEQALRRTFTFAHLVSIHYDR